MTPEQRAEKIVLIFMGYEKGQDKSFYDHVLTEIKEAVEEAFEQRGYEFQDAIQKCLAEKQKARAEAFEEAAKILEAEDTIFDVTGSRMGELIAEIRALKDEKA